MASFRFIHCADLHIDSPLRGLEADPDAPADAIRRATREAFTSLIDYAIAHEVAFVLAAGDLYDGDWQDWRTGQFLVNQVGRLSRTNPPIPFIAIRGNHDAENVITRRLALPPPAEILSADRPQTYRIDELGVRIHGQSFRTKAISENLTRNYPEAEDACFNIGMLHTSLDGRYQEHNRYASCSLDDLRNRHYQYWALGHVHRRIVLLEDPWIVFPGNIQGRHARETGPKGATLVTVTDGRITGVEPLCFDTVRWEQVEVDLSLAPDEDTALNVARNRLMEAVNKADGRLLIARAKLVGATPAYAALNRDPGSTRNRLKIEAEAMAGTGALWLEQVVTDLRPPCSSEDVPGRLSRQIDMLSAADLLPSAAEYCRDLLDRVAGLREELGGPDHPAVAVASGELPQDILDRARALLRARLAED